MVNIRLDEEKRVLLTTFSVLLNRDPVDVIRIMFGVFEQLLVDHPGSKLGIHKVDGSTATWNKLKKE